MPPGPGTLRQPPTPSEAERRCPKNDGRWGTGCQADPHRPSFLGDPSFDSGSRGRAMQYRTLGRTGWKVGEIGYGMWGLAGWSGSDDSESIESLHRSIELGCNFFDTAWGYGEGTASRSWAG